MSFEQKLEEYLSQFDLETQISMIQRALDHTIPKMKAKKHNKKREEETEIMARKVWGNHAILPFRDLESFAKLVAEHEREECAKICDEVAYGRWPNAPIAHGANSCASAIRKRSSN